MSCCNFDNDILFDKIKDLEKNVKKFEKEQNKTNAEIYTLLKESGVDLSQYYALNEEDYTKVLTSEDDINTLEPGTYKIVEEDMPQNAPIGVASSDYDGTLIQSNSYAILFENGYLHIGSFFSAMNRFRWNYVINSNLINIHLQYYMLISRYSDGEFIDDIHILDQNLTGVFIVNSTTQNLPVQQNGIIISRIGTATNSLFVTFIPEDSFDVYHCAKKSDGTWTEWEQVAFLSDVPSLTGYATQEWVNQQIQDITGGSVTADWVKKNFLNTNSSLYTPIKTGDDLNNYKTNGTYFCSTNANASTLLNNPISNSAFTLFVFCGISNENIHQIYVTFDTQEIFTRRLLYNKWSSWNKIAYTKDIPSLNGYATESWVQSQNYLTEIPDNYTTDMELTQAITTALIGYATQTWVNQQGFAKETDIPSLSGYATQAWVNQQGFLKEIPDEYVTSSELQAQNYATQTWVTSRGYQTSGQVDTAITEALNGYATQTWVNQQNFAHESDIPSLSGYATQTWVNNQNFATEEWVGQQGYQTVQQVKSLINTATADMLTQEDLDTLNYATENWVLQTALNGYATQAWVTGRGYATQTWVNKQSFAKTTIDDSLATRPSQEFERFMIRSTDYHGVNAVSGAEGYLVMHMAVDPDAPTKFIRSSGIVVNNTYVNTFTTSDESSVGLATNNQGTVSVVGMSNNAKQMFILVKPDNID